MYCYECGGGFLGDNDICGRCDCCNNCCECSNMKLFKNRLTFHKPRTKQAQINISPRFISAEIEVASIKTEGAAQLEAIIQKWKGSVVHDGSLPQGGFEINTAPAAGHLFAKQIQEICAGLKKAKATVTNQCGLHIHLDARDFDFYDIRRLVRVYAAIEPALFKIVPSARRNSHYAMRCAKKYEDAIPLAKTPFRDIQKQVAVGTYGVADLSYGEERYPDGFGGTITNRARYNALSLHSWFYHETIEFRIFEGCIDASTIIKLGNMCAAILDYALYHTDEEVTATMNKKRSYESLMLTMGSNKTLKGCIKARTKKFN